MSHPFLFSNRRTVVIMPSAVKESHTVLMFFKIRTAEMIFPWDYPLLTAYYMPLPTAHHMY